MKKNNNLILSAITGFVLTANSIAAELVGEGPNLKPESRITQQQIESQELSLDEIRQAGLLIFTTPYTKADGYGDGPHDYTQQDQRSPTAGNRPTLQGNGSFLRVNGLDAQTCLECHAIVSNRTIPATLGIGGVGGINTSAIFQPDGIDVGDADFDGVADFNGRLINPPFLFGSGGVELLGLEMTQDLQLLRQKAIENPGQEILLESKGVVFGSIIADTAGALDVSNIKGVDADLVVKPFGRKGETATVRDFDIEAMAFHLGMQANEAFGGEHADADNDGVRNEISEGDLSALSIFLTTMQPPHEHKPKHHKQGKALFHEIGCASCHQPVLETRQKFLPYTMSGNIEQPFANAFYAVDLTQKPMKFKKNKHNGISVPLFSDLKRHNMGQSMAEDFTFANEQTNQEFITARLWGIADTAPYMHDGRAFTLVEAISMHGSPNSDAVTAAENFAALSDFEKNQVLSFLLSLRTPKEPVKDLLKNKD